MNGDIDVINQMLNSQDYLMLDNYKDGVRLGFEAPEIGFGYSRGFGVSMTGYVYVEGAQLTDELQDEIICKTFEEIKQIIINSNRQELIDDIPLVEDFYNTIAYIGSLSYEEIVSILFDELE